MSTQLSKSNAKRLTLVYQLVAALCLLAAGAIGILGLPDSQASAVIDEVSLPSSIQNGIPNPSEPGSNSTQNQPSALQTKINPNSIAARLAMLDNAPRVSTIVNQNPVVNQPVEQNTDNAKLGSIIKRVSYTGYIDEGDRKLAFISIDGVQRIVAQGDTARAGSPEFEDLHIKLVRPKVILVTNGDIEQRVDLAMKSGASITMASGSNFVVAEAPDANSDVTFTPEELEELDKLKPKARAAKERMLRRQKLGIPPRGLDMTPLASFKGSARNQPASSRNNRNNRKNPQEPESE